MCAVWVHSVYSVGMAAGWLAVQRLGRQNTAQAGSAGAGDLTDSSGDVNAGSAGRLGAVLCVLRGCIPPFRRQDSRLVAVRRLGRQNTSQAGITSTGDLTDASGDVDAGLAGRMGAVFCDASYDGLVVRKLYVNRYDVDFPVNNGTV